MAAWAVGTKLVPYVGPSWAAAAGLSSPSHRVLLAQAPTPVHEWALPRVPCGFRTYIKRDDMTGSTLSGNKVRKLEFLMAEALHGGYDSVITVGAVQSNHCRATALAARQLGLKAHLILRSESSDSGVIGARGNVFLSRLCGARVYPVPRLPVEQLNDRTRRLQAMLAGEGEGERAYVIPLGGSDVLGLWGYLSMFDELRAQVPHGAVSDIVVACGSGGTACGLAIANYLTGGTYKIHAVSVSDKAAFFHAHVNDTLQQLGLANIQSEGILHVVDGHKGLGYGRSTPAELDFIADVVRATGVVLDPVYTGKAARGLVSMMEGHPSAFQGRDILFVHTGGVYGAMDGRLDDRAAQADVSDALWLD